MPLHRFICALCVSTFLALGLVACDGGENDEDNRDCNDFTTQRQAQRFFLDEGGPDEDPHNLDADNDGIACEELP